MCQALLLVLGRQSLIIDSGDPFYCNVMSRHLYFPIGLNYLSILLSIHRKTQ